VAAHSFFGLSKNAIAKAAKRLRLLDISELWQWLTGYNLGSQGVLVAMARPIRGDMDFDGAVNRLIGLHLGQTALGLFENAEHVDCAPCAREQDWLWWIESRMMWNLAPEAIHASTAAFSRLLRRESTSRTMNRSTSASAATHNLQNRPYIGPLFSVAILMI
jgi:hypothetical protein